MSKPPHEILQVSQDATQDEIRQAYRRLARIHHPDVSHKPDATQRFQEISQAYQEMSKQTHEEEYAASGAASEYTGMTEQEYEDFARSYAEKLRQQDPERFQEYIEEINRRAEEAGLPKWKKVFRNVNRRFKKKWKRRRARE